MADLSTLARPYAKAAFELAREDQRLKEWGAEAPRELPGREEHVVFGLPRELRVAPPG